MFVAAAPAERGVRLRNAPDHLTVKPGANHKEGCVMKKTLLAVFAIFLLVSGWVAPLLAQEPAGMLTYRAHAVEKPINFVDLRDWVENECATGTIACFYESFGELRIMGGTDQNKDAVEYVTQENGVYYRNTVIDNGIHLNLYTFADPELKSFLAVGEDAVLAAPIEANAKAAASCDSTYKCNCVLWVRNCRASWLPTGMTYIWEKKSKMSTTNPSSGRVAVHDIYYPYGHVSYVKKVDGSKITIEEANYSSCKVTNRTGKPSDMSIVGYIKK